MNKKCKYKVSTLDETISIYVVSTNPFDALEKAKEISERDDLQIVERIDE